MKVFIRLVLLLLVASWGYAEPVSELKLERVLDVRSQGTIEASDLQPSGLAICNDKLIMVSDRHNQWIFELKIKADAATAAGYIKLGDIPKPDLDDYDWGDRWWSRLSRGYDWEGVSCDDQGRLYLLSETLAQVLVREVSGELRWQGSDVYRQGRTVGLFEQMNAYAEGLAVEGERMVVAAERHPRGLVALSHGPVSIEQEGGEATAKRWRVDHARYLQGFPSLHRPEDFSGLWLEGKGLYTLERNHFQVCRRDVDTYELQRCWDYRRAEENPVYRFQDRRFGKAEGLARLGQQLYLVLDNNGGSREQDPGNSAPLLLVFSLPPDW